MEMLKARFAPAWLYQTLRSRLVLSDLFRELGFQQISSKYCEKYLVKSISETSASVASIHLIHEASHSKRNFKSFGWLRLPTTTRSTENELATWNPPIVNVAD
ncbi:uncharacterized protein PGTG_18338 [Puccinia graminis f. sp. tritici CRL 75-36-700-3]|uniref:Uncharacterized protein n=1 Tax=Puccinia graminis f. sp. tritici (strain CRL 75-36-700-3 / race SCCL) TaxID=418459 RepID=E3L728_PUCGT|nr:uncharacterized protein PGTG_18338 [Puccinia graminis f. sp. tritici CRL 75-36-700-3]EFP92351.2 hypothetical protein PGTG_18338 [Puccinia graminis f. sp. tritici CRL 75-36-700-3]